MDDWQPIPEGQTGSDRVARRDIPVMSLTSGTTLSALAAEGVLFSSAITLTGMSKPSDPLVDLLGRRPDIDVRIILHAKPFFTGLGTAAMPHWNHALMWVSREAWPTIRDHLAACLFLDAPARYRTEWLQLTVPDQLLLQKSAALPQTPRTAIWLLGLVGIAWRTTAVIPAESWGPARISKETL